MKESGLKNVRNKYNRIKNEQETLKSYKNELEELAKDVKVKRFVEHTINSNFIMVFMGSYIKKSSENQNDSYITYERDPDVSYRLYMDLETTECYKIDKNKCLEFETEHLTLYLPISEYTEEEYYKKYSELQKWFRAQLIYRSQSDIIKELQEKYEIKHKKIYPYFYKIDTITDLPINEYVNRYPADGFIENYCLSSEELMRVKLYRKQLN